jgi:hypothetical protein
MDKKLTLKLDSAIIEMAKKYAAEKGTSISRIVQDYFEALINPDRSEEITPLVKKMTGIAKVPEDLDTKKSYREYINKKYK